MARTTKYPMPPYDDSVRKDAHDFLDMLMDNRMNIIVTGCMKYSKGVSYCCLGDYRGIAGLLMRLNKRRYEGRL